ncbi:ABC transporter ATP-binding protein [Extibacter muris]|uniref:ABC transporter ATP-binding protein n=1 Tax=Extibacter muris TaxID=1796622 RepID=UPI001D0740A9|nr:oligopeptide/dipeptide ABC transporter ATP-binding protein [Extibacter muris]MCB6201711.1 ATP-binding cassette domain-containing protein [Extibacter muris]MCQ4663502.1 ATP-binding cassette domain-containing protein [Extibacter muris]MCQ4693485.1 ATP-binding cassette domain-containing protein [Extibacter muris]
MHMTNQKNVQDVRPLLKVNHVSKHYSAKSGAFSRDKRLVRAVEDISFEVYTKETVGIVGESGCGKTTLGKLVLHLFEPTKGEVLFGGQDVLKLKGQQLRDFRRHAQIVYQDPYTSLNPRNTIGKIIGEPLLVQKIADKKEVQEKVLHMLEVVGLSSDYYGRYPFECSGGQRQRVGIARALILNPKLIVCDEAVSALDVSTQSQIINLLDDIQEEFSLTYLFISHGLSVVRHMCSRVMVMYLGRMVEIAECEELYHYPQHPYTQALFSAIVLPDPEMEQNRIILEGDVPSPVNVPDGCAFHTRCRYADDRCRKETPLLREIANGHSVACHRAAKEGKE